MLHYSTINRNLNKLLRFFLVYDFRGRVGDALWFLVPGAKEPSYAAARIYILLTDKPGAPHVRCSRGTEMQAGFQLENMKGRGGLAGG